MKTNFLLSIVLPSSLCLLLGCAGGSGSNADSTVTTVATVSTCGTAGYVQTAVGCVPQGSCPSGYGYATNVCYPAY